MKRNRVIAITNDVIEQWFVPKANASRTGFCRSCGDSSPWLSLSEAAATAGLRPVGICELAERLEIHSSLTAEGHILICAASIGRLIQRKEEKKLNDIES